MKLLRTKYGPAEVATYNSRAWELSGVHLLNAGRVNEALTVLWGLYEKMLEAQKTLGRVHKGTPLVWISDCLYRLNFPVHAKRYLMLTLCEDAVRGEGSISAEKTGVYFRLVGHGLPERELQSIRKGDFPTRTRDARESPISGGAITAVG